MLLLVWSGLGWSLLSWVTTCHLAATGMPVSGRWGVVSVCDGRTGLDSAWARSLSTDANVTASAGAGAQDVMSCLFPRVEMWGEGPWAIGAAFGQGSPLTSRPKSFDSSDVLLLTSKPASEAAKPSGADPAPDPRLTLGSTRDALVDPDPGSSADPNPDPAPAPLLFLVTSAGVDVWWVVHRDGVMPFIASCDSDRP